MINGLANQGLASRSNTKKLISALTLRWLNTMSLKQQKLQLLSRSKQVAKPHVDQQWACKIGPPDYPGPILGWVDRDYSMHERDEAPQFHRSCPVHRQPT